MAVKLILIMFFDDAEFGTIDQEHLPDRYFNIRFSRGIGFSSGAYRIIELRLWEILVDGDLKFDRKWEHIE